METVEKTEFRNYDEGPLVARVRDHYRKMRMNQTVEYGLRMREKYLQFDMPLQVWDAMEKLNELVDVSDPDLDLPNSVHLIQTAEGARLDGKPDWYQLVGLIHDLGKMMYFKGCDEDGTSQDEQWGLVGDIFIVGCKIPDTVVYPEFNELNPDMSDPRYNTDFGIYEAHCGIDECQMAWGHDEYLYQVLKNHPDNCIPEEGMVCIRYHSFYPWHTGNSYSQLTNEKDAQYKNWVREFNKYDLYTKRPVSFDLEDVKAYYQPIIEKYLGTAPVYF